MNQQCFYRISIKGIVIDSEGKISTKDRAGNGIEEIKIMADEIKQLNEEWLKTQAPKPSENETEDLKLSKNKPEEVKSDKPTKLKVKKIYIKLIQDDEESLRKIHRLILKNPSSADERSQIILVFGDKPDQTVILLPQRVTYSDKLAEELSLVAGQDSVVVKD